MDSIYIEANKYSQEGNLKEFIRMMDVGIKEFPENQTPFLVDKMNAQLNLELYEDAIITAIELDEVDGFRSANKPLEIAKTYLKLNDINNTFKWLEVSVNRGFQNYFIFDKYDLYEPLRGDERLDNLIHKMKENIGFGKPIKSFDRISITGGNISPQKYIGKVFLIDFWATWCPPCVAEIPNMKKLYSEFNKEGFEIIGISVDSDLTKLNSFLEKNELEWPIIFSGAGWDDETKELYGIKNVPSTWLIDKKGILRHFCLKGEELHQAIENLLYE